MKQSQRIFLSVLLLLGSITILGKDITGIVRDQQAKPVSFANVILLNATDSTFITGTVTDENGYFSIATTTALSSLLLKVSSIGYMDEYRPVHISNMEIVLKDAAYHIGEVVVKGRAAPFKLTNEGIATSVAGTPLSQLGSAQDVLAHIPGVYSKNGSYEVFGRGTPEIYINERKVLDSSEIDNLKSNDIKNVEVVRNPGTKYDATVKSVIKITTKKPVGEGFGMSLRSSYYQWENSDFVEQANWTYRHKGLDVFGNHSFSSQAIRRASELTQDIQTDTTWHQDNRQLTFDRYVSYRNSLGFNYQFGSDNSVGARYTIRLRPTRYGRNYFASEVTANGSLYDVLQNDNQETSRFNPSHQLNVYYRGKSGRMTWGADVDWLRNDSRSSVRYNEQSEYEDSRTVNTSSRTSNELFASKLTWGVKTSVVEMNVGLEYTHTKQRDAYDNAEGYIAASASKVQEQHLAPFVSLDWQLPGCVLTTGARYEQVWFDYREGDMRRDDQSRRFSNIFPTLSLQGQLGKAQIDLSYVVKTRRPSYSQLSDAVIYSNRFTYQSGNSKLKQELIHDLSLAAAWKFLQFSVGYNDRRDAIIYWADLYPGSNSISLISLNNIRSLKSLSFMVSASPTFGVWSPELSIGLTKQWYDAKLQDGTTIQMNAPVVMFSWTNTLEFGKGWMVEANLSYTTRGDNENCKLTRTVFTADASLYKSLLKNKLSLRLGMNDLFHSQKSGNTLYYYQLKTTQVAWSDSRELFLTARYHFNLGKSKYEGTGAGKSEMERL
ncbi:MAG: outer membrane beta-barrel protein [Mediterranea sp.]|jgi:hypothetical protein|nr:outer membrane beta-barrel protein [Mediterranea sp.]